MCLCVKQAEKYGRGVRKVSLGAACFGISLICGVLGALCIGAPAWAEDVECAPAFIYSEPALSDMRRSICRNYDLGTLSTTGTGVTLHAPAGVDGRRLTGYLRSMMSSLNSALAQVGPIRMADIVIYPVPISGQRHGFRPSETVPRTADTTEAFTDVDSERCIVVMYEESFADRGTMRHVFAHETFHCVQGKTYRRQYAGEQNDWWTEGSAEWFANLVQQGTTYTDEFVAEFEQKSKTTSLSDMDYPAVVFFFWLANVHGPSAPLLVAETLPSGDYDAATLARALSPDAWHDFGQKYIDGQIRFPDGRAVNSAPAQGEVTAAEDGATLNITAPPLTLPRARISFGRGDWQVNLSHGTGRMATADHDPLGGPPWLHAWQGETTSLSKHIGCTDEDKETIVLATSEDGGPISFSVGMERVELPCDPCPVGRWVQRWDRNLELSGMPFPVPRAWRKLDERTYRLDVPSSRGTMTLTFDYPGALMVLGADGSLETTDPRRLETVGSEAVSVVRLEFKGHRGTWKREHRRGEDDVIVLQNTRSEDRGWTRISSPEFSSYTPHERIREKVGTPIAWEFSCTDTTLTMHLPSPFGDGAEPRVYDLLR